MEMDCNLKNEAKLFKFFQRVDIKLILNGHGLFSIDEIKLKCSFKCSNTMLGMDKAATDHFSIVFTKNLRNPRDHVPLTQ